MECIATRHNASAPGDRNSNPGYGDFSALEVRAGRLVKPTSRLTTWLAVETSCQVRCLDL